MILDRFFLYEIPSNLCIKKNIFICSRNKKTNKNDELVDVESSND